MLGGDSHLKRIDDFSIKYWGGEILENEKYIFMPNDIFERLENNKFMSGRHKLFSVVYLYVICWVYRYGKSIDIYKNNNNFSEIIKEISGINRGEKRLDYIISKNGVLDILKITKTINISKTPATYNLDNFTKFVTFNTVEEYVKEGLMSKPPNRILTKEPLIGTRNRVVNGVTYLGTFQDVEYTFKFSMKDYIYMSSVLNLNFETIGFYLYLMSLSSKYGGVIKRSRKGMAKDIGVTEKTITKYKKILKEHGLIREYYDKPFESKEINIIIVRGSDLYASTKKSS